MNLLRLPPELIIRVSSHLTTPELGYFRRTCKHVEANLFDTFAREFFTKRQFMIEHISLQALVDIANHPVLSRRLTEVIIGLDAIPQDPDYLTATSKAAYKAGYVTRSVLLETGRARDMLVEAFSKLPNLRTVGLRDYDARGRFRDGEDARWRSYGWSFGAASDLDDPLASPRPSRVVRATPESTFPVILYALGQAQSKPESIEVFLRKRQRLTPTSLNILDGYIATSIIPVLAGLKKLMLTVALSDDSFQYPHATADNQSVSGTPLKRLLHNVPNLETLRLNFDAQQTFAQHFVEWLGEPALVSTSAAITTSLPIPPVPLSNLTGLDLGMLNVPRPALLNVITKANLKSLSLWKVTMLCKDMSEPNADPGPWTRFLLDLANVLSPSTRLSSVLIGFIFQSIDSGADLQYMGNPVYVRFAADTTRGNQKSGSLLDKVTFRAAYGSDVRKWLRDLANRVTVPPPFTFEDIADSLEDDDDDYEDDSDEEDESQEEEGDTDGV